MPIPDYGVILYDVENDGCLNGVFTNEYAHGLICNEIAIKKDKLMEPNCWYPKELPGEYEVVFFERPNNGVKHYHKIMRISTPINGVYDVKWYPDSTTTNHDFRGKGYVINSRQFVVRYEGK